MKDTDNCNQRQRQQRHRQAPVQNGPTPRIANARPLPDQEPTLLLLLVFTTSPPLRLSKPSRFRKLPKEDSTAATAAAATAAVTLQSRPRSEAGDPGHVRSRRTRRGGQLFPTPPPPPTSKKTTKIQSPKKKNTKSCTTKLHKSKKIVLAAWSKLKRKMNKFCKILAASDASHVRKRRMQQQQQEKVGVVHKDQRRFLKVDPRGGGRKEGRTMTNDDQWTIFRKPRKPVNERHLSVPTLPNNWNVFKLPYLIPVSYFRIVRRYRMSHLKGNLKLGFHQKLCFSWQNLVPFLHVSVSYTHMVFPYRTSLSLSYDVPPDRVPEVLLLHLMRELWKMSALAGVAVLCGQWSQLWTKPGPVPCLCFDETCKFELHCQFWYWMAALTERMNTGGSLSMWSVYMSTTSQSEIHLLDLLCSCTMDGTCIMPTGFVESTEVWGTVL